MTAAMNEEVRAGGVWLPGRGVRGIWGGEAGTRQRGEGYTGV